MSVNSRFAELILALKSTGRLRTDVELAELLGTNKNGIGDMKKGRKSVKLSDLAKLKGHFHDLNTNWLMEGNGSMFETVGSIVAEPEVRYNSGIPLVSSRAIAGKGNFVASFANSDIIGRYIVPEWKGVDFLVRVSGKSMEPNYLSGDIIACRILIDQSMIQWNKAHLISTRDQGLIVKRLRPSKNSGHYLCVSDNIDFPPFEIDKKAISGIAIIVGLIRTE